MSTLYDALHDYAGRGDLDLGFTDQTLGLGFPQTDPWTVTIDATPFGRPATTGAHNGWLKYAANNPLGVTVDLGIKTVTFLGLSTHMRVMFKGFNFVNGQVEWRVQDVALWYSDHHFKWPDWAMGTLSPQREAIVNIATNGAITRVSGDTFSTADEFNNTRETGFARLFGIGHKSGNIATNMLFGRILAGTVTDGNHCKFLSVDDTWVAATNVRMQWGSYPEQPTETPRNADFAGTTNFQFYGGTIGGGSTSFTAGTKGIPAPKNLHMEGFLLDDARNPQDDIFVKGLSNHKGNPASQDVHNESWAQYTGGSAVFKWFRCKGSLHTALPGDESQSVRPIIKTVVTAGQAGTAFDVTMLHGDFHDSPNNGVLQLNANEGLPYVANKARLGALRVFPADTPSGWLIQANIGGTTYHDESYMGSSQPITNAPASRLAITIDAESNPAPWSGHIAVYRVDDPGNGNYQDQIWRAAHPYNTEDAFMGWRNAQQPLYPPTVPRSFTLTPADSQITLRWQAPSSDGGSPISSYETVYSPADLNGVSARSGAPSATSMVIDRLVNQQTYGFYFFARNAMGDSPLVGGSEAPNGLNQVVFPGPPGPLNVGGVVLDTVLLGGSGPLQPSATLQPSDTLRPNG